MNKDKQLVAIDVRLLKDIVAALDELVAVSKDIGDDDISKEAEVYSKTIKQAIKAAGL